MEQAVQQPEQKRSWRRRFAAAGLGAMTLVAACSGNSGTADSAPRPLQSSDYTAPRRTDTTLPPQPTTSTTQRRLPLTTPTTAPSTTVPSTTEFTGVCSNHEITPGSALNAANRADLQAQLQLVNNLQAGDVDLLSATTLTNMKDIARSAWRDPNYAEAMLAAKRAAEAGRPYTSAMELLALPTDTPELCEGDRASRETANQQYGAFAELLGYLSARSTADAARETGDAAKRAAASLKGIFDQLVQDFENPTPNFGE
jgi:hypothetical protein